MYSSVICGAVSLAAAVYLFHAADEGFFILFLISSLLVIMLRSFMSHRINKRILISVIVFCAGGIRYGSYCTQDIILSDYCNKNISVTGVICDVPQDEYGVFRYKILADRFSVNDPGARRELPVTFKHKCKMYITSELPYEFGETVTFEGTLKQYTENPNSSAFDSKLYYNIEGIFFRMFAKKSKRSNYTIPLSTFNRVTGTLRNNMYKLISYEKDSDTADLLSVIYLDISTGFDENLKDVFYTAGTWRFLYNGRIHCMIILSMFGALSYIFQKRFRDTAMIAVMLIYIALNSSHGAAIRAMLSVIISLSFVRLTGVHNFADTLSAAVIAIGLSNPLMMYDSGLIMSVCSAVAAAVFFKPVKQSVMRLIPLAKTASVISLYIIFNVIMLPLSARMFNAVSLYSLLISPVFFILIFICFVAAPFYFLPGLILGITAPAGFFLELICKCMILLSRLITRLPFAHIYLGRVSLLFIITWFLGIFIWRFRHKYKHIIPYAATAFSVFALTLGITQIKDMNVMQVHFISVGQGDGAAIRLPLRENILIDGGGGSSYSSYDPGKYEFLPYLIDNGITDIDIALVSHFHEDHVMGIVSAMKNLHVDTLFIPDIFPNDEFRRLLIKTAEQNHTKIRYICESGTIKLRNNIEIDVILPFDITKKREMNEMSVIYRVRYGDFKTLFAGDIGDETEKMLCRKNYDLASDILKVPHHGSSGSSSEKFLRAVSPKLAVAGLGQDNTYKFPHKDTLIRYKNNNIPFLSTAKSGNIVVKSKKDGKFEIYKN